jgi:formylmethanofuran dehydrogenase subunit C
MSLTLTLHTTPAVPLEAEVITPDRLAGLNQAEIAALPVQYGNQKATLGDFFRVTGTGNGEIRVEGDLSRVKLMGAGMTQGRLALHGDVGMHVGAGMRGGEIVVEGNASDWAGAEMVGGRLEIKGNAGHLVGSGYRGSTVGMRGGEIIVHGNAGNEVGGAMRRGLIVIGGESGDFTGVNMLAGTLVVLGQMGWRSGAGMKRGSIISMRDAPILPTFTFACAYHPPFLPIYLRYLRGLGLPIEDHHLTGAYRRWSGDSVELNRGEILLLAAGDE